MRKFTFLLSIMTSCFLYGQHVFVETGRNNSSFKFENNAGEEQENLQSKTFSYVTAGYKHQILTEGLNITTGLSYNTYGALGSDTEFNTFFEWDIHYLGLNLGLDYTLFTANKFSFYIQAGGSAEIMLDGVQTINNEVINVKDVEEFDDIAYFLRGGGGVRLAVSETTQIYAQYLYGTGLALNDNNNSAITELRINVHSIGIGVLVDISPSVKEGTPELDTDESQN
ncbi:MAG: hypothetical protein AAFP76_09365 [Bacteroidota bacterium]